jgi:electron transfer flavoprotein alpha subunit
MTAAELVAKGFYGYSGWNDAAAEADFKATGGAGKGAATGGSGSNDPTKIAQDFATNLINAQAETIKRETSFLDQYTTQNPFVFDEELAKKSATAEYQPYYTELLDDYTKNIDLQKETTRGSSKLLTSLQKLDSGTRTNAYNRAVAQAEEGFAGQGMFFSGIKQKAIGEKTVDYQGTENRAGEVYNEAKAGYDRTLQGYDIEQSQKTRDIGREQETAIEGGILTRKKEALANYYTPLEQSYYRQFPTGSGNTLKGYEVPEYYRI